MLSNLASTPNSSSHKHSLCGGLQDVGHEGVATRCGALSLCSLKPSPTSLCLMLFAGLQVSAFYLIQLQGLAARGRKNSHYGGQHDVGHKDVTTGCGVFSLCSIKHSPCAPPLMLFAGLQDVGHEDVATRRGAFSLRSLNQPFQLFIQSSFNG